MTPHKIVIDDKIPFIRGVFEDAGCTVAYLPGRGMTQEDLADADALITRTVTQCNKNLLSGTKIKVIATTTIGFNHIDLEYCHAHNISWKNAPGCNAGGVQSYVAGALAYLALKKNYDLTGKTLGIVGVGHTGKKTLEIARLLGLKTLLCDSPRARTENNSSFVTLEQIAQESDIISFHVPLNYDKDPTFHLADETFFSKLKKGSVLINASRGEVVDTQAVLNAINNQTLAYTVLDVWENEPFITRKLLDAVTLGTMHIAGYSAEGKFNGSLAAIETLESFFGFKTNHALMGTLPEPKFKEKLAQAHTLIEQFRACYPIENDDALLRANPNAFEALRGAYDNRREIPEFVLKITCE